MAKKWARPCAGSSAVGATLQGTRAGQPVDLPGKGRRAVTSHAALSENPAYVRRCTDTSEYKALYDAYHIISNLRADDRAFCHFSNRLGAEWRPTESGASGFASKSAGRSGRRDKTGGG